MPREVINDKPWEHTCYHGTVFTSDRCDFKNGVLAMTTSKTTPEQLCADVSEMIGFHATNVLEKLNGFQGYGAVRYTIVSEIDSLQGVQAFIDAKGQDIFARATIDIGAEVSPHANMLMPVLNVLDDRFDVGIVPKKVSFDGRRITTDRMLIYHINLDRVRGPYRCQMSDKNIWERLPN